MTHSGVPPDDLGGDEDHGFQTGAGHGPVFTGLLNGVARSLSEFWNRDDTRAAFEAKVVTPLIRYLGGRFSWIVRMFQIVAVLVMVQTAVLMWLLFREIRKTRA